MLARISHRGIRENQTTQTRQPRTAGFLGKSVLADVELVENVPE